VAESVHGLATVYHVLGNDVAAEPLYQRSLAIREEIQGPEHPYVALALSAYATFLRQTGRSDEAQGLEARAAAIETKREWRDVPWPC
jgi:hypothetical protein